MFRKILSALIITITFFSYAEAQTKVIYYVNPFSNDDTGPIGTQGYAVMDPDTGIETVSGNFPMVAGRTVTGANAIIAHPTTGEMWAILKLSGQTGRELVKIDPETFAVTDIGNTGRNFSTLAFNGDGSVLYAVTGNGDANPEVMYTLDQTTGAATLQCALGNGADGEIIAYNSNDGKFYHWSGNGTVVYERIDDLTGPNCTVANIGMAGYTGGEIFGAVYDSTIGKFYISNISSNLLTVNVDGTSATVVRPTTFAGGQSDARGLGLRFLQEIDVTGNSMSIASGDVTPSTDDDTDFGTISVVTDITKTFTIENEASGGLSLTGNPLVALSGDPEFAVTALPSTPVAGNSMTTFQITFTPSVTGTKTAVVSIDNSDTNENPYTFTVQATAAADTDGDGQIDDIDPDDDNDGVSDFQEEIDGTDPFNNDSFIEHFGNTVCSEWNGFLSFMFQVLEQRNVSSVPIVLTTTLYNSSSDAQGSVVYTLQPSEARDILVNDFQGFTHNAYGTICTTVASVAPTVPVSIDYLDGNYVTYLLNQNNDDAFFVVPFFKLAYAEPFSPGKKGAQYLTFNTYNPSLSAEDAGDFIGSFIQVSNDDSGAQSGQLLFRGFNGEILRSVNVSLGARQRVDVDVHSMGANLTGLLEWIPSNANAPFRVRQNRYYYQGSLATGTLRSVTSILAKRATGEKSSSSFNVDGRYAVLEISNALANAVNVQVDTYSSEGAATTGSPGTIAIPAKGTRHIILDEFLSSGLGNVIVDADTVFGIVANLIEYGIDPTSTLTFANNFSVRPSVGTRLRGNYNNFLGSCVLRVSNNTSAIQTFEASLRRFDLTSPAVGTFNVPANGSLSIDTCNQDVEMSYGVVTIIPNTPGTISADVVRKSAGATLPEFTTPLTASGDTFGCVGIEALC